MKLIKTEDAVGQMLCHDMTQIIKGEYKDARFRKGHIVTEEDTLGRFVPKKIEKTCDQTRKTGSIGVKGLYFKLQEVE